MTKKRKREISLQEAQAVIDAHREKERRADREKKRLYIGRYFRYRNSYGASEETWWLYGMVTGVSDSGYLTGLSFQQTSRRNIELQDDDRLMTIPTGWEEIEAAEFWAAADVVRASVLKLLQGQGSDD
jgi:hypothetical protein